MWKWLLKCAFILALKIIAFKYHALSMSEEKLKFGWEEKREENDKKKVLCRLSEFIFTVSQIICLRFYLYSLFLSVGSTPLAASLYYNTKKYVTFHTGYFSYQDFACVKNKSLLCFKNYFRFLFACAPPRRDRNAIVNSEMIFE